MTEAAVNAEVFADFARRTTRRWAVAEALYGIVLALAVAIWVPWKSPLTNTLLIGYALGCAAAAPGLLKHRKWGWRLSIATGLLGLLALVLVVGGLLASWVFLHGTFGDFGLGASIGALLFASVGLQVLGLYPVLKLRALLRREVRAQFSGSRGWVRTVFGLLMVPLVLMAVVHFRYGLDPIPAVPEQGRVEALLHLRAALRHKSRPPMPALKGVPVGSGPVVVTYYRRGKVAARVEGSGVDLAEAIARAADALASKYTGKKRKGGWIKVDRLVAAGPVPQVPVLLSISVNPGIHGLRRLDDAGAQRLLLPDDLIKRQGFGRTPLVPGIRELRFGLDAVGTLNRLGMPWGRLERFVTEAWIEDRKGGAWPVVRGNTPGPDETPQAFEAAAIAGGDFVLRQIRKDGRFNYQYYPLSNHHPKPNARTYSLPRHAGTIYALSLMYGETGDVRYKKGAERAIKWLDTVISEACGAGKACVVKDGKAGLGSAALTAVGMAEYQRRSGDERYAPTVRKLMAFILDLQRPDGDFDHTYLVSTGTADASERAMFASEEAALALVMAHGILGDGAYLEAAERALDYLTGPKYDFFLGGFIYGADHWTCIAADEAYPRLDSLRYLEFCSGYAAFLRRMQYEPEGWDQTDFRGHYGYGGFMPPQAPAAAGFTEAIVSTYTLSQKHGLADPQLKAQAFAALGALARDQIRPGNSYLMPRPRAARGGIRRSLVESEVRIDFTQHAISALIRGARLK